MTVARDEKGNLVMTPGKSEDEDPMDNAAMKAADELAELPKEAVVVVAKWWKKWYMSAGHKRLGRVLIGKM